MATIKACTGVSTCQVPSCPTAPLAFNAPRPDAVCVMCAVSGNGTFTAPDSSQHAAPAIKELEGQAGSKTKLTENSPSECAGRTQSRPPTPEMLIPGDQQAPHVVLVYGPWSPWHKPWFMVLTSFLAGCLEKTHVGMLRELLT